MGRPKSIDPRIVQEKATVTRGEAEQLRQAAEMLGLSKTQVIVRGIQKVHAEALSRKAIKP